MIRLSTTLQEEIVSSVANEITNPSTSSSRGTKAIAAVKGKKQTSNTTGLSESAQRGKDMLTKSKLNPPPSFNPGR